MKVVVTAIDGYIRRSFFTINPIQKLFEVKCRNVSNIYNGLKPLYSDNQKLICLP